MSDSYNIALSTIEKRRLIMRSRLMEKRSEIYTALPQVEEMTDKITELGAESAIATIQKDSERVTQLKREISQLKADRTALLIENGYADSDLELQYFCQECKDTGYVNGRVCQCMRTEMAKARQAQLTALSPAPEADFADFQLEYYPKTAIELSNGTKIVPFDHMAKIYDYCQSYAEYFNPMSKSLLLVGGAGLGKTHLACSIAKVAMEKGYSVMYSSSQSLFTNIEQSRYTGDDMVEDILNCDLFILDDLGAENLTTYSQSVLYNIVNTRMITGKPCIYTSNITRQADLQKRYGEKISSRLLGSCTRLYFYGKDIRILKNR